MEPAGGHVARPGVLDRLFNAAVGSLVRAGIEELAALARRYPAVELTPAR